MRVRARARVRARVRIRVRVGVRVRVRVRSRAPAGRSSLSSRLRSLARSALSTAPLTQSTEARSRRVAITSAAAPETTHFVTSVGSLGRAPACVDAVGGRLEGPAMQRWPKRTGCESTGRLSQGGEGADARAST